MSDISVRFELRRDTAANWTAGNVVLLSGEPGVETDTGRLKVGNGTTPWTSLPYLGSEQGVFAVGTVSSAVTLSAQAGVYSVATLTLTAAVGCAITLPPAVAGYAFDLYVTNPASSVVVPSFAATSGGSLAWLSPLQWDSTPGALNIIGFESTVNGAWNGAPVTSGLGPPALLQAQQAAYAPGANGTVTIPSPLTSPYVTRHHVTLPTGTSTNPISLPAVTTAGIGLSFGIWVDQPSGGVAAVSWTGGAVRWSGTAPTTVAAGNRMALRFDNIDGLTWDALVLSGGY